MEKTISKADIRLTRFIMLIIIVLIDAGVIFGFKDFLTDKSVPLIVAMIIGVFTLPVIIITLSHLYTAKNSSLILTETGISGARGKMTSDSELNLPIDKIDSIYIHNGIMDKLEGGKTLMIRSVSGVVKFPWVQNAEEFRNAVIAKIEEYKKGMSSNARQLVSAVSNKGSGNEAAKIKELKELFDQGLISQSEFEAKRKELLSKM